MALEITTNNVPRLVIDAYELTPKEREEFDYIRWDQVENGNESPEFFRYKGQLYDIGEFDTTTNYYCFEPHSPLRNWDGIQSQAFYFGILFKWVDVDGQKDYDRVIVGRYCS